MSARRPWPVIVATDGRPIRDHEGMGRDWVTWHEGYKQPGRGLARRLEAVRRCIRGALDVAPPGRIQVVSLCAGDGRDLFGAAAGHDRRADIDATLVETDPVLAGRARTTAAAVEVRAEVVEGDAGTTSTVAHVVPADVLLLCGIFGNVTDDDVQTTIRAAPSLARPGATVLWTRGRTAPDLTPTIRRWFDEIGGTALTFDTGGPAGFAVGAERLDGPPAPFRPDQRLFRFVERSC